MRATSYAMDLEEIGVGGETQALVFDMRCPQIGVDSGINNWTKAQCVLRVRTGNPCTVRCKYGKEAKAELDASGIDYRLESILVAGGPKKENKKKKPLVLMVDPNKKWPGRQKKRNINIAIDLLNGCSVDDLVVKYLVQESSIKKISYQYYRVANPEVFDACPSKTIKLDFARINKNLLLPHLVFVEDERRVIQCLRDK